MCVLWRRTMSLSECRSAIPRNPGGIMYMSARASLLILTALIPASAMASPNQFVARYLPIGVSGSSNLLAVDSSGNFFIVATVEEQSGLQQIRAIKSDPQGNVIASFDFGSGSDVPAGAAVDPLGNLVVIGNGSQNGGFIMKLDSQLTRIVFSTSLQAGRVNAVALDAAGNIYVTGSTGSDTFPVTPGAFQTNGPVANGAGFPVFAFVSEISADGAGIVYSTYFGSDGATCLGDSGCVGYTEGVTSGSAIAVDVT